MKFLTIFLSVVTFSSLSAIVSGGDHRRALASEIDFVEEAEKLEVDPQIIENSPVIQKWIEEVPDVAEDIVNQRSFPTLIRLGYSKFPSRGQSGGILLGVEDLFLGDSSVSFSGEYVDNFQTDSDDDRFSIGGNLNFYLLPLGSYVNIAPTIGYQSIELGRYQTDGVNLGVKVILALSPQGAADISFSQSFISPTDNEEVGITEVRAGYAVTDNVRVFAGINWQNSIRSADSQVNLGLEWMP